LKRVDENVDVDVEKRKIPREGETNRRWVIYL
jgi:hypothetical protein